MSQIRILVPDRVRVGVRVRVRVGVRVITRVRVRVKVTVVVEVRKPFLYPHAYEHQGWAYSLRLFEIGAKARVGLQYEIGVQDGDKECLLDGRTV